MNSLQVISTALRFASLKHRDQRRKDVNKSPYINHPIDVMNILIQAGVTDTNTIVAALLHDTVEDTQTTFDEIENEFGIQVRKYVEHVTDDKQLDKITRKRLQIEHVKDSENAVKLIKIADKLSNLSDLSVNPPSSWSKAEIEGYAVWSYCVLKHTSGINLSLDTKVDDLYKKWNPWILSLSEAHLRAKLETYYSIIDKSE